jgi:hypothetical protein
MDLAGTDIQVHLIDGDYAREAFDDAPHLDSGGRCLFHEWPFAV